MIIIFIQNGENQLEEIKQILFMPGFLTITNFATKRSIKYGGPMGELNCLADLMNACLALCHKVIIKVDIKKAAYELVKNKKQLLCKYSCLNIE